LIEAKILKNSEFDIDPSWFDSMQKLIPKKLYLPDILETLFLEIKQDFIVSNQKCAVRHVVYSEETHSKVALVITDGISRNTYDSRQSIIQQTLFLYHPISIKILELWRNQGDGIKFLDKNMLFGAPDVKVSLYH
jgi:hypothetical protein